MIYPSNMRKAVRPAPRMVCGCNGMIYMSMCAAAQEGVTMAHEGDC